MAAGRTWFVIGLCASFVVITGAAPPPSAGPTNDFCTRLARNSGINKPSAPDGHTVWTVSALNFGQRFIVGGSAATGIGVKPIEPASLEDYHRLEDMCLPDGKGAVCKLVGPVNFQFIWKGHKITTPMPSGERATVSVLGTKTTCRSGEDLTITPAVLPNDQRSPSQP